MTSTCRRPQSSPATVADVRQEVCRTPRFKYLRVVLRRGQPPADHAGTKRTAFGFTDDICEVCPHSAANVDLLHAVHCGQSTLDVVDASGSVCAAVRPVSKRTVGFGQHAVQWQLLEEILPLQHVRVDREVAA